MRHVAAAFLCAVGLLGACDRPVSSSATADAARSAFEQYILDFWVRRDTTALDRALSPSMVYHYNGRDRPGDPQAHLTALRNFGGAFPDLTATIDVFTAATDIGAAMTTWAGTHAGPLCQTPGTGQEATWVVAYMFSISDGRIVELWEAWDEGGTYRDLGISC